MVVKNGMNERARERDKTDRETMNFMSSVAGDLVVLEAV